MSFPSNFVWGAAASSYQIEGAWNEDGKGPSLWDMFTRMPGRIWEGHNGNVACDHYHRYKDDVAMFSDLGLQAYRLSISWPRVLPEGAGRVNEKGLDFYDRLVDELLAKNVQPWVTLFHWDFPYALFLRGGWLNPDSPKWFAKYTEVVVSRLSDRVKHWLTLNEPQCFIGLGMMNGEHAPGFKMDTTEALLAGHHSLIAHGRAVEAIRAKTKQPAQVGWSMAGSVYYPATQAPEDIAAARHATVHAVYGESVWNNSWWSDPAVFGNYPEEGLRAYGDAVPKYTAAEMKVINTPMDFYGCSIFFGVPVKASSAGTTVVSKLPAGHPHSHYLWKHTPEALYWGPKFFTERYKMPMVITENGMSNSGDWVSFDGRVHDAARIEFMSSNLLQVEKALREGADVRGYFAWSVMDNFEWAEGYKHRFGLVHVDYETQRRTPKDSAYWYGDVIRSNGGALDKFASAGGDAPPYVIKETMRYVNAHLSEMFNIKDLAAHMRCHPDFLSRKFKKHTGIDLSLYIRRIRIDHARELLKNPDLLIDDAAEQSGFTDRIHFSKVFRRLTGQTPGQYQRQFRVERETSLQLPLKPKNPRSLHT
ncbi:MAG: GH1 family beta-glucosidase [Candidatus Methylacidiphilales bacterium]|nr:GH1 family beta-glucosidase [Candidatus Methylacidiphilales bacterium]